MKKSYKKVKKPVRPWLCRLGESYKKVIFIFYVEEEKWNTRNKRVDSNWGGPNCWKQLANGKVNGRPTSAFVDELSYSNDVSTFSLHVLFLLAGTTRSTWWPCSPGLGKNFPGQADCIRHLKHIWECVPWGERVSPAV